VHWAAMTTSSIQYKK
jgi:hypothetical protein